MIVIDNKFEKGEVVYLKTDKDQLPRMVYGFDICGSLNEIIYRLACGTQISNHYDFEITREVNVSLLYNTTT